jgi:hypothetical protein
MGLRRNRAWETIKRFHIGIAAREYDSELGRRRRAAWLAGGAVHRWHRKIHGRDIHIQALFEHASMSRAIDPFAVS